MIFVLLQLSSYAGSWPWVEALRKVLKEQSGENLLALLRGLREAQFQVGWMAPPGPFPSVWQELLSSPINKGKSTKAKEVALGLSSEEEHVLKRYKAVYQEKEKLLIDSWVHHKWPWVVQQLLTLSVDGVILPKVSRKDRRDIGSVEEYRALQKLVEKKLVERPRHTWEIPSGKENNPELEVVLPVHPEKSGLSEPHEVTPFGALVCEVLSRKTTS